MQGKRYGDGKILKYDDVSEKIITEMFMMSEKRLYLQKDNRKR